MTVCRLLLLGCLFLAATAMPARGDLVVGTFSGKVVSINPTSAPPPVAVNDTFQGLFHFDPSVLDADSGDPTSGKYFHSLSKLELTFSNGFQAATLLPILGHVLVDSTAGSMRLIYPFGVKAPTSDASFAVDAIDIWLQSGQSLLSDDLPQSYDNAAGGTGTIYSFFDSGVPASSGVFDFSVSVDSSSVSMAAVPEPSAFLLLLLTTAAVLVGRVMHVRWQTAQPELSRSGTGTPRTNQG
jgi:hypothetical protein